jgi:predicted membrane chloride channel (bestrophin family)
VLAAKLSTEVPTFAHEAVFQMTGLTTFILALLLTLRINRTYERWWEAWRAFRRVGDCATALTQQATVFCSNDAALQADVARWSVLWCHSVLQFTSGRTCLDPLARRLLTAPEVTVYDAAANKFNFVELKMRRLIMRMKLPMDQALSVDESLREGFQNVRTCSTIKQTALPYGLTLVGLNNACLTSTRGCWVCAIVRFGLAQVGCIAGCQALHAANN